jgi:hypothetical protein
MGDWQGALLAVDEERWSSDNGTDVEFNVKGGLFVDN